MTSGSDFVLHHERIDGSAATRSCLVLHGALGSGQNFRGFVRRLAPLRPDTSFVLVDLRAHGSSQGAPSPNTLENAARDLEVLAQQLEHEGLPPVRLVIGHSLGGKVALEFARLSTRPLDGIWMLDSDPGTQDPESAHEIKGVIAAVRSIAPPITSRQQVVERLVERGFGSGLANWMTTNLKRQGEHYAWVFDLDAVEELLRDYFRRDLWPYLEVPDDPARAEVHLVIAEHSDRWSQGMRERARRVPETSSVRVHEISNAGHWLHVDNPDALLDLVSREL